MRAPLLVLLRLLEAGLGWFAAAEQRVAMRRFLKDHPEVHFYPDGERAP